MINRKYSYLLLVFIFFACKDEVKNIRKDNLEPDMEIVIPKGSQRPEIFTENYDFKNSTANALNSEGMAFIRNGEYTNAEEKFIEALKYESDNPTILNNLGNLTIDFGDTIRGIKFFKKAIEFSDSAYFSAIYNLGNTYSNMNRYNDSEEILTYILENFDNKDQQSITNYVLAKVYLGLKECEKAEKSMENAEYFYATSPEISSRLERLKKEIQNCYKNSK